jgi:hypothetical protein
MPLAVLPRYLGPPALGAFSCLSPRNGLFNTWLAFLLVPAFFKTLGFQDMVFPETLYIFPQSFMSFHARYSH